jgi:hypothetical protein
MKLMVGGQSRSLINESVAKQVKNHRENNNLSQINGLSNGTLNLPLGRPMNQTELTSPQRVLGNIKFPNSLSESVDTLPHREKTGDKMQAGPQFKSFASREEYLAHAKDQRRLRKERVLASAMI